MKKVFEITDEKIISEILDNAEFGTLALCVDNKPYSVPINFVESELEIFFHGAKKGRKIDIMKQNANASFSVVEDYSLLPSYFSSDKGDACPATHMFKSIIIDGTIEFIDEHDDKVHAMSTLMKKLQKEGKYIPLNHEMYKKALNAVAMYKLVPIDKKGKFKLGQNFNEERYTRVVSHLEERGTPKDLVTIELLKECRK